MILENGKFIEAIFANNTKNAIITIWQDDSTGTNQEIVIEVNLQDRLYQKLLDQYTIDEINTMTDQKRKVEREAFLLMVKHIALNEGLLYDPEVKKDSLDLDMIFNPTVSDEATDLLFNIKLKIFDMEQVLKSSNTELKKQLRQAKTPLESMYIAGKFLFE